jgi:hypothetical protein
MAIVLSVLLWQLTAFAIFVGHGHVANLDQILADDALHMQISYTVTGSSLLLPKRPRALCSSEPCWAFPHQIVPFIQLSPSLLFSPSLVDEVHTEKVQQ